MNLEQHLLLKLIEECTEVAKEAAKCMQFGMDEVYEPVGISNRERLIGELNDVMAILQMLNNISAASDKHNNLGYEPDVKAINAKIEKVLHYLQYSVDIGQVKL